jgi:hypothetical protein
MLLTCGRCLRRLFWFAEAGHIKDLCLDAMARLIACFEVAVEGANC